jgi:hypothetical protein
MPPRIIHPDPRTIIPYHDSSSTAYFVTLFQRRRFDLVPPIPVVRAPKDLAHLGKWVNYNGHHRTKAAIVADVKPRAFLIQNDEDIKFLKDNCEVYPEIIDGLGDSFREHYELVCLQAGYYSKMRNGQLSIRELVALLNQ